MFRLNRNQLLALLTTLAFAAGAPCIGCTSTLQWKVDADQHTEGNVEGSVIPEPIPGITPATPAPTARSDPATETTGFIATAGFDAHFKPDFRFDLLPNTQHLDVPDAKHAAGAESHRPL